MSESIILPKEIERKVHKKLIKRFLFVLILSNLSVYFLSSPESKKKEEKASDYISLRLSLETKVSLKKRTPVSIYDSNNNLLTKQAFILKHDTEGLHFKEKNSSLYDVEIKSTDVKQIIQNENLPLKAFPRGVTLKKKIITKPRGIYEINF